MRTLLLVIVLLAPACRGPRPREDGPPSAPASHRTAAPEDAREWSVRYKFPVGVGFTQFDLGAGLDNLTTLSVVPTAEFARPIGRDWTLLPFVGFGGGWFIDDGKGVAIFTTGVQADWSHAVDERTLVRVVPRIRYDANLNRPDGLLGDWGRVDLALELRHALGDSDDAVRFDPGIYLQGFWFWDDIDFEVPGQTPDGANDQKEVGLSFGTRDPFKVFGLPLPRVFVGYRFGDGIETFKIRFGKL